jgi:gliding motility-associated protein GldC
MKKASIQFDINLDDNNIPEKIIWKASDAGNQLSETKALACSVWDEAQSNTLKIDLWTKHMRQDEMDKFFIDTLGGLSQTLQNATGDTYMSGELNKLCDQFVEYIKNKDYNSK